MPIWTNSSPDCDLSRTLLPSLTELRANRQVCRNLLTWVELMGLKPAAHHRLLIHALPGTAEGKIDRFAACLSQINLRLDIVPAMVFVIAPGSRLARARNVLATTRPNSPPASAGGYCGGYLNPPVLRFTRRRRLRRKGG